MLAWASLNQFPWASPAYFCYVAPLAVVAGVALASAGSCLRPQAILPWTLMALLFAVVSPHRAYMQTLGAYHVPRRLDAPLNLTRAHLNVSPGDAETYQALVSSIERHLNRGRLVAGPDSPEVYFLVGLFNPTGVLFDFFSGDTANSSNELVKWAMADVVVVNLRPEFSPAPKAALLVHVRREFPHGEVIGKFEIRWR